MKKKNNAKYGKSGGGGGCPKFGIWDREKLVFRLRFPILAEFSDSNFSRLISECHVKSINGDIDYRIAKFILGCILQIRNRRKGNLQKRRIEELDVIGNFLENVQFALRFFHVEGESERLYPNTQIWRIEQRSSQLCDSKCHNISEKTARFRVMSFFFFFLT